MGAGPVRGGVLALVLVLAGCGVDGRPTPPEGAAAAPNPPGWGSLSLTGETEFGLAWN